MARTPQPTRLKILAGAQPCRINRNEPKPEAGSTPCPDYLDDVARDCWHRMTGQLDAMGLLTRADGEALALYCSTYSQWMKARSRLEEEGMLVITKTTVETSKRTTTREVSKINPMVSVVAECQRQMVRLLTQFGMTPSSRSSLNVPGKAQEDEVLAFLKKPKGGAKA